MTKIYLYLARRNQRGFELVSVLNGQPCIATRVPDLKKLNLPKALEKSIADYAYEKRMEWELWIESAASYAELLQQLKSRGYSNLPIRAKAAFMPEKFKLASLRQLKKHFEPTVNIATQKKPTMIRRRPEI